MVSCLGFFFLTDPEGMISFITVSACLCLTQLESAVINSMILKMAEKDTRAGIQGLVTSVSQVGNLAFHEIGIVLIRNIGVQGPFAFVAVLDLLLVLLTMIFSFTDAFKIVNMDDEERHDHKMEQKLKQQRKEMRKLEKKKKREEEMAEINEDVLELHEEIQENRQEIEATAKKLASPKDNFIENDLEDALDKAMANTDKYMDKRMDIEMSKPSKLQKRGKFASPLK